MDKILSIIIPTYNMEEYLSYCIESIIIPSINEIEVLIINDGSKDKSINIAKSFADKFPDSIKVIDKENGNYGSCVNVGLKKSNGKYIRILDADDCFVRENFEEFVSFLKTIDSDLVLSSFAITYQNIEITSIRKVPQKGF